MATLVEQLAAFTQVPYAKLPAPVVEESKRLLLDSIGAALAAVDSPKGRIGIEYGRMQGASGRATVIGTSERLNVFGAAFANAELINALDMDAILPPGHVTPYVLPGALAVAEDQALAGKDLIRAIAVSHEMSWRLGKAMDYLRDTRDGKVATPLVFGYSSTVFGATAAIGLLQGMSAEVMAHALGIAGCISPVNAQMAWFDHAPSSTIKYLLGGTLTQAAMTAAHMAALGHRGDLTVLDDREVGYARFMGTSRWEPAVIRAGLGTDWNFPAETSYKPYAHCRILHALADVLMEIVRTNAIRPQEIDGIKVWVEGMVERPIWLNRQIHEPMDAQFSIAHGIALAAHCPPTARAWQDPAFIFRPSVLALMDKVSHEVHPDYVKLLTSHGSSRPAKVEVRARGTSFTGEKRFPKGSPSPDPSTAMTNGELIAKFHDNAQGRIPDRQAQELVTAVFGLEAVQDIGDLMVLSAPGRA
ncbi:MAG: MmgE/PrpD family protein [Ramlibacter sp.]|jgi:2-methylcitrate dehydratase PrpD|uniref:MmgE/PrpD family protein n=1 Tax=Ramlibacter sp. TaxID=1917967 RepID=UPI00261E9C03|nr:MmgE/PrpD family protein [Ramlibacter sp.]MDB5750729.1 MmgE/PrpD family protein [Ramlibacter sp.]